MNTLRFIPTLCVMAPALLVAACAPGGDDAEDGSPSPFPAYEMAFTDSAEAKVASRQSIAPDVVDLEVEQLAAKLEAGNIRLIDVRTAEEVATGMIAGAEHVPLDSFDPATLDRDDGREVILYCRSGRRSAIAGRALSEHTGEPASHLAGGIIAWREAGQPVTGD